MDISKKIANSCVPLDRSPAALALALVLGLMLVIVAMLGATAAETTAAATAECETISLGGQTTAAEGDAAAAADITICYRPLPADMDPPAGTVLQATTGNDAVQTAAPGRL